MTEDQPAAGRRSHDDSPSAAAAASQLLSRLADLARTSLQAEASLAKQTADLTWATFVGDLDRTNANKAYVESVTRESARYWRTVGDLGLDYASDLLTLGKSVSRTVLREVSAAGRKPGTRHTATSSGSSGAGTTGAGATGAGATESTHRRPVTDEGGTQTTYSGTSESTSAGVQHDGGERKATVSLRGSTGQRAEGRITVANKHPRPRRIQLSATDLVDSTGAAVGATLDVSPTTVTVPSGQERSVSLGVDLDGKSLSAGNRYTCTIEVSGGDEATIEVSVEVSA